MEQTTLTPSRCFVRDLADGQEVNEVFVVRGHTRRQRRNGEPFLKLQLGDTTGAVEAVIWDEVEVLAPICPTGSVVRILGRYAVDERYGAAVTVKRMRVAAEDEYELADLTEAPARPYEEMAAGLAALVETIERPHLKTLLGRLIDPSTESGAAYHSAPAAKYYHQAYKHGLLEHCLSVAEGVSVLARGPFRGGVDRDLAVTGALLHDIGKTEVYSTVNGAIEMTDRGKLLGEIPLRLLHGAPRDRADRRLSARRGRGPPPHHPEPPRQARARQPGRALHARGHAGPLRGQPRRQPRQLRPDRALAGRRGELVGLRPRHLDVGLLCHARAGAQRRSGVA